MEREGKAGGGRVSIGSSCVVCCCVCVCLAMYPDICIQFVFGQIFLSKPCWYCTVMQPYVQPTNKQCTKYLGRYLLPEKTWPKTEDTKKILSLVGSPRRNSTNIKIQSYKTRKKNITMADGSQGPAAPGFEI